MMAPWMQPRVVAAVIRALGSRVSHGGPERARCRRLAGAPARLAYRTGDQRPGVDVAARRILHRAGGSYHYLGAVAAFEASPAVPTPAPSGSGSGGKRRRGRRAPAGTLLGLR